MIKPDDEHARFITEQLADGAVIEGPAFGNLFDGIVPL